MKKKMKKRTLFIPVAAAGLTLLLAGWGTYSHTHGMNITEYQNNTAQTSGTNTTSSTDPTTQADEITVGTISNTGMVDYTTTGLTYDNQGGSIDYSISLHLASDDTQIGSSSAIVDQTELDGGTFDAAQALSSNEGDSVYLQIDTDESGTITTIGTSADFNLTPDSAIAITYDAGTNQVTYGTNAFDYVSSTTYTLQLYESATPGDTDNPITDATLPTINSQATLNTGSFEIPPTYNDTSVWLQLSVTPQGGSETTYNSDSVAIAPVDIVANNSADNYQIAYSIADLSYSSNATYNATLMDSTTGQAVSGVAPQTLTQSEIESGTPNSTFAIPANVTGEFYVNIAVSYNGGPVTNYTSNDVTVIEPSIGITSGGNNTINYTINGVTQWNQSATYDVQAYKGSLGSGTPISSSGASENGITSGTGTLTVNSSVSNAGYVGLTVNANGASQTYDSNEINITNPNDISATNNAGSNIVSYTSDSTYDSSLTYTVQAFQGSTVGSGTAIGSPVDITTSGELASGSIQLPQGTTGDVYLQLDVTNSSDVTTSTTYSEIINIVEPNIDITNPENTSNLSYNMNSLDFVSSSTYTIQAYEGNTRDGQGTTLGSPITPSTQGGLDSGTYPLPTGTSGDVYLQLTIDSGISGTTPETYYSNVVNMEGISVDAQVNASNPYQVQYDITGTTYNASDTYSLQLMDSATDQPVNNVNPITITGEAGFTGSVTIPLSQNVPASVYLQLTVTPSGESPITIDSSDIPMPSSPTINISNVAGSEDVSYLIGDAVYISGYTYKVGLYNESDDTQIGADQTVTQQELVDGGVFDAPEDTTGNVYLQLTITDEASNTMTVDSNVVTLTSATFTSSLNSTDPSVIDYSFTGLTYNPSIDYTLNLYNEETNRIVPNSEEQTTPSGGWTGSTPSGTYNLPVNIQGNYYLVLTKNNNGSISQLGSTMVTGINTTQSITTTYSATTNTINYSITLPTTVGINSMSVELYDSTAGTVKETQTVNTDEFTTSSATSNNTPTWTPTQGTNGGVLTGSFDATDLIPGDSYQVRTVINGNVIAPDPNNPNNDVTLPAPLGPSNPTNPTNNKNLNWLWITIGVLFGISIIFGIIYWFDRNMKLKKEAIKEGMELADYKENKKNERKLNNIKKKEEKETAKAKQDKIKEEKKLNKNSKK